MKQLKKHFLLVLAVCILLLPGYLGFGIYFYAYTHTLKTYTLHYKVTSPDHASVKAKIGFRTGKTPAILEHIFLEDYVDTEVSLPWEIAFLGDDEHIRREGILDVHVAQGETVSCQIWFNNQLVASRTAKGAVKCYTGE
jgi:hypothetical protein